MDSDGTPARGCSADMESASRCADLIERYCAEMRIRERQPRTIEYRRWLLGKADRDLPHGLDQVSDDELRAWLFRDKLSRNSRAAYYNSLNAFYSWAVKARIFPFNPLDELPRPRGKRGRPRPVDDEELRHILAVAAEPYRLWALIAAYQGARCVEIAALDRDDVQRDMTLLRGKGDKDEYVPTHPDVYAAVSALPPGPVARKVRTGERASPKYVSDMANEHFAEDLRMPGVTMHRLRHWCGTRARQVADLRAAQLLLRHADVSTTAIYTAVPTAELRAAVLALPRFSPTRDAIAAGPASAQEHPLPPPTAAPDPRAGHLGSTPR